MASPAFPEPPTAVPPTTRASLDEAIARLSAKKDEWPRVGIARRLGYLKACRDGVMAVAERWVTDGCKLKGLREGDSLAGEEWLAGPMTTVRNIRLLIHALEAGGQPAPSKVWTRPDGQKVARVFPQTLQDKVLYAGFTADVWIEPGQPASQGRIYRDQPGKGKLSLVLGAGNVASIPPMDALYKLFAENEVVLLKMNPVNAHVGPKLEEAFGALIRDGFLAIVYGGASEGAYLSDHPAIDTLHVTGSDRTYDAIVWGPDPEEQKRRKQAGDRKNPRPFSAELGCVTPVLVVPGPWSDGDIDFQARHVAGMVAQNASFNCNAAKVIVTAKGWGLRHRFLDKVREHLGNVPGRKAYYPGAMDRYKAFVEKYPTAKRLIDAMDNVVPWTVIPDVPATKGEYALTTEAFCGVLAEVALDAEDAMDFLPKAAEFANENCWGTLSCCVLVDPKTEKRCSIELDKMIGDLRYGGIGINAWPGVIYGLVVTPWGAFPGHPPEDIQSGSGVVHNTFLFDHPQKAVVRAPFRIKPTPPWFADHRNLARVGERLTYLEANPSLRNVGKLVLAALRG
jgi:acyl-CoA reductase-like NAD-dependent aldehyde dehydrogenase